MTSSSRKRVAVIGAGSAGLVTLKSLLEDGHDACAFEQASDIGGLWNYGATGAQNVTAANLCDFICTHAN